ncbi:MAG: EAL domain-containing protein [Gammaproteobacteria bacterium]|jgi:diguanylate cyclase (GGDEF)-like protein|nr:EAL domain-containing protein [Gammaproteobacteria bacterium]
MRPTKALQNGEIDVLGMFVSQRRETEVDFARPHLIVNHRIFIPAGADRIARIDDLAGRSVIVQREAFSHEYLANSGLQLELTLVESDRQGLLLLTEGRHDAALLTEHRSRHTLQQLDLDGLAVSGPPVLPVEYALAVREGNSGLLEIINTGLERVMASGEFDRIYGSWLQPLDNDAGQSDEGFVWPAVAGVLLAAFAWLGFKLLRYRRDMRLAREELDYLRERDALTGLLSRHALEQSVGRLCQSDTGDTHSLLYINVDQFRLLNEALGHHRADQVLRDLAGRLAQNLPSEASIARLGGDEFAALLERTDTQTAEALGTAVLTSLRNDPVDTALKGRPLTISIGVVSFGFDENGIAPILRRADCACLAAKEDGGSTVHVWHPDDQRLAEKLGELGWVTRIQTALSEERFSLYGQKIVSAAEGPERVVAIEVLARLIPRDAAADPIPAGRFIGPAERYFITADIDRYITGKTLEWMASSPDTLKRLDRVNINLSGRSIGDTRFLAFLDERVRENAGLLPKLCIEVTETALISNLDKARETLERLHRGGCRIALDDFGTGVSSMNYLRQLPVDYLKIDGSFVRGIDRDQEALDFIRQINNLGHSMRKITVAECVETEAVKRKLQEIGVDLMQGYLFGRPLPLSELAQGIQAGYRAQASAN